MPNFNYENPRNIRGNSMESPEDHLFYLVIDSLAYEGYSAMAPAMLRKRGGSEELIAGYGTKKKLCQAALEDAAKRMELIYEGITEDARIYLDALKYTKDESWKQLERLLYRHIYQCFHPKNRAYVLAAAQESQLPPELQRILPDTLHRCFGEVLARLILAVSEVKNADMAAMTACSVCGSINVFVQQPGYCRNVYLGITGKKPNYAVVEDFLNNYFLRSIAASTAINKPF